MDKIHIVEERLNELKRQKSEQSKQGEKLIPNNFGFSVDRITIILRAGIQKTAEELQFLEYTLNNVIKRGRVSKVSVRSPELIVDFEIAGDMKDLTSLNWRDLVPGYVNMKLQTSSVWIGHPSQKDEGGLRDQGDTRVPIFSINYYNKLGGGAFGKVYVGNLTKGAVNTEVAVKVLSSSHPDHVLRFEREIQIMKRLQSIQKNFSVPCLGSGNTTDGRPFYVMPLYKQGSVESVLEKGVKLSWQDALKVIKSITQQLNVAHGAGIFHHDLKPGNILFDDDNFPLIADWGLAHITGEKISASGFLAGTTGYIPPERDASRGTALHDIYSLGAILRDLCSDPEIDDLRKKMMARKPSRRPESCDALLQKLDEILSPPTPVPPSITTPDRGDSLAPIILGAYLTASLIAIGEAANFELTKGTKQPRAIVAMGKNEKVRSGESKNQGKMVDERDSGVGSSIESQHTDLNLKLDMKNTTTSSAVRNTHPKLPLRLDSPFSETTQPMFHTYALDHSPGNWRSEFDGDDYDEIFILGFPFYQDQSLFQQFKHFISRNHTKVHAVIPNPKKPFFYTSFADAEELSQHAISFLELFETSFENSRFHIHLQDTPMPEYKLIFKNFSISRRLSFPGFRLSDQRFHLNADDVATEKKGLMDLFFSKHEPISELELWSLLDFEIPSAHQKFDQSLDEFLRGVYDSKRFKSAVGFGTSQSSWYGGIPTLFLDRDNDSFWEDVVEIQKFSLNFIPVNSAFRASGDSNSQIAPSSSAISVPMTSPVSSSPPTPQSSPISLSSGHRIWSTDASESTVGSIGYFFEDAKNIKYATSAGHLASQTDNKIMDTKKHPQSGNYAKGPNHIGWVDPTLTRKSWNETPSVDHMVIKLCHQGKLSDPFYFLDDPRQLVNFQSFEAKISAPGPFKNLTVSFVDQLEIKCFDQQRILCHTILFQKVLLATANGVQTFGDKGQSGSVLIASSRRGAFFAGHLTSENVTVVDADTSKRREIRLNPRQVIYVISRLNKEGSISHQKGYLSSS